VKDAYFLGHSMGGRIALELAMNHPEMVKALIMASSSAGLTPPRPQAAERRRPIQELLDKGETEAVVEMLATLSFSPDFKTRNPAEFNRYLGVSLQNKPDGLMRIMRTSLLASASPPDLSKLRCPVMLIAGEYDPALTVEETDATTKAIPRSKVVLVPAGHAAAIESPDRFNSAVMEFLSEVGTG
jgi:2-succinyl-6-hydroxy-2,4-cyclohexadiene-1-carboxylate synthase